MKNKIKLLLVLSLCYVVYSCNVESKIGDADLRSGDESLESQYINDLRFGPNPYFDLQSPRSAGQLHLYISVKYLTKYFENLEIYSSKEQHLRVLFNDILIEEVARVTPLSVVEITDFYSSAFQVDSSNVSSFSILSTNTPTKDGDILNERLGNIIRTNSDNDLFLIEIDNFVLNYRDDYDHDVFDASVEIAKSSFIFWNRNLHFFVVPEIDSIDGSIVVDLRGCPPKCIDPDEDGATIIRGDAQGAVTGGIAGGIVTGGPGVIPGAAVGAILGTLAATGWTIWDNWEGDEHNGYPPGVGPLGGDESGGGNGSTGGPPSTGGGAWAWDPWCGCLVPWNEL